METFRFHYYFVSVPLYNILLSILFSFLSIIRGEGLGEMGRDLTKQFKRVILPLIHRRSLRVGWDEELVMAQASCWRILSHSSRLFFFLYKSFIFGALAFLGSSYEVLAAYKVFYDYHFIPFDNLRYGVYYG